MKDRVTSQKNCDTNSQIQAHVYFSEQFFSPSGNSTLKILKEQKLNVHLQPFLFPISQRNMF